MANHRYAAHLQLCRNHIPDSHSLTRSIHAQMIRSGFNFNPSSRILNSPIDLYAKLGNVTYAQHLFDEIPEVDIFSRTIMITAYSASGNTKQARRVFDSVPASMRNAVCYSAMISGYARNSDRDGVFAVFKDMVRSCHRPDDSIYASVLNALRIVAEDERDCEPLHCHVVKSGTGCSDSVLNALLMYYVTRVPSPLAPSSYLLETARSLLDEMPSRSVVVWYNIVSAYFHHGFHHEAEELCDRMWRERIRRRPFLAHSIWLRSPVRDACSFGPVIRTANRRIKETDERAVLQEVMQVQNQPQQEIDLPDGLLSVPLFRHQKIGLAWMQDKEARVDKSLCRGGILADDQGLGKTISIISLIQIGRLPEQGSKLVAIKKAEALNLNDDNEFANLDDVKAEEDSSKESSSCKLIPATGTLIVCPATLLRQWARELADKVSPGAKLKVLVYHGSKRINDPSELAKYDVVLTSYTIVSNEVPEQPPVDADSIEQNILKKHGLSADVSLKHKGKRRQSRTSKKRITDPGALAKVHWLRVVLDEAQMTKNHTTRAARACCGLQADIRWCLSGTPLQNSIDELFSYFRFLKYDPYSSYAAFCEGIKIPILKNSKSGYQKLQAVLKTFMLRRTKETKIDGKPIINLPSRHIQMINVNFTSEERVFYDELEYESQSLFEEYAESETVGKNYAKILSMLLRLRQACNHPCLVRGFRSDSVKGSDSIQMLKQLPNYEMMNLLNQLQSSAICQICNDPREDAMVATCGHTFCNQCILNRFSSDDNNCPANGCGDQLRRDAIFSDAALRSRLSDGRSLSNGDEQHSKKLFVESNEYMSSKIRSALEILHSLESIQSKAIVFSQWTRMLDLMESSLKRSGTVYRRLDGSMSLPARDKAVTDFSFDPEVSVILISLKAGNLGLNLVAASHVILLDPWWNPTAEDQAIDRAHRIGQTRAVTVSRLAVNDTIEDRILALQEEKRETVASAFGKDNSGLFAARLTPNELKFLFMGI